MKTIAISAAFAVALAAQIQSEAQAQMQAQAPSDHEHGEHAAMPPASMSMGQAPAPAAEHDHHPAPGAPMGDMDHDAAPESMAPDHQMPAMHAAVLGRYAMTREASGTSWQPDASRHDGLMAMRGDWMVMGHAVLNGVYDWQSGRRGDEKLFASGMLMASASRHFADGKGLQLRAMLSPDPFMGKSGYPILLASGETADGATPLIDRQHPHDLFMELSASVSQPLSAKDSVFLYAGLPGEPAFGPPAFMHRASIVDSPEAPISHHWLDSTHITFGVLTAGYVHENWKLEVSRFRGREPDQNRFDIETGALDSTAARVSWNPTPNLALQASWADAKSPEQLAPDEDQKKYSVSAIYTRDLGDERSWTTTLAWGRRASDHDDLDAFVLESAFKPNNDWTIFGRAERTENNELISTGAGHGPAYTVGKASLGAVRDFAVADHAMLGLGGLYAFNFLPDSLNAAYGRDPSGAMLFVRVKLQ